MIKLMNENKYRQLYKNEGSARAYIFIVKQQNPSLERQI